MDVANKAFYNETFAYYRNDIMAYNALIIRDEKIKGKSDRIKGLSKYFAALQLAKMIITFKAEELAIDGENDEDKWKERFGYETIKTCLACNDIDLDILLEVPEVIVS